MDAPRENPGRQRLLLVDRPASLDVCHDRPDVRQFVASVFSASLADLPPVTGLRERCDEDAAAFRDSTDHTAVAKTGFR